MIEVFYVPNSIWSWLMLWSPVIVTCMMVLLWMAVFQKLPEKTPRWYIGVIFVGFVIITVFTVGKLTMYNTIQIQKLAYEDVDTTLSYHNGKTWLVPKSELYPQYDLKLMVDNGRVSHIDDEFEVVSQTPKNITVQWVERNMRDVSINQVTVDKSTINFVSE